MISKESRERSKAAAYNTHCQLDNANNGQQKLTIYLRSRYKLNDVINSDIFPTLLKIHANAWQ